MSERPEMDDLQITAMSRVPSVAGIREGFTLIAFDNGTLWAMTDSGSWHFQDLPPRVVELGDIAPVADPVALARLVRAARAMNAARGQVLVGTEAVTIADNLAAAVALFAHVPDTEPK